MEGEGMVAVVRGLQDAGLAVTMLDGNRQYTLLPNSITHAPNSRAAALSNNVNASTQQSLSPQRFTAESGTTDRDAQAIDGRYASMYKTTHCNVQPTSPPIELTEFPPQRSQLYPGHGNFQVGGTGSGATHSPIRASSPVRFGGGMCWPDRGSVCMPRPSQEVNVFASSLRKYPCLSPDRSSEVMEKLINYTQGKGLSRPRNQSSPTRLSEPTSHHTFRPRSTYAKTPRFYEPETTIASKKVEARSPREQKKEEHHERPSRSYDVRYFRDAPKTLRETAKNISTYPYNYPVCPTITENHDFEYPSDHQSSSNSVNMEVQAAVRMISKQVATVQRDHLTRKTIAVPVSPIVSAGEDNVEGECYYVQNLDINTSFKSIQTNFCSSDVSLNPRKSAQTVGSTINFNSKQRSKSMVCRKSKSQEEIKVTKEDIKRSLLELIEEVSMSKSKKIIRDELIKKLFETDRGDDNKIECGKSKQKRVHKLVSTFCPSGCDYVGDFQELVGKLRHCYGCTQQILRTEIKPFRISEYRQLDFVLKDWINNLNLRTCDIDRYMDRDEILSSVEVKIKELFRNKTIRDFDLKSAIIKIIEDIPIEVSKSYNRNSYLQKLVEVLLMRMRNVVMSQNNGRIRRRTSMYKSKKKITEDDIRDLVRTHLLEFYHKIDKNICDETVDDLESELVDIMSDSIDCIRCGYFSDANDEIEMMLQDLGQLTDKQAHYISNTILQNFQEMLNNCNFSQTYMILRSKGTNDSGKTMDSTDFSIRSLTDSDLNANLDQYTDQLTQKIHEWLDSLNVSQNQDRGLKEVVINDLAADIIDRHKYLELHPQARGTEADELETLKYQIFKWINKLVGEENQETLRNAHRLRQKIDTVPVPVLTIPHIKKMTCPRAGIQQQVHSIHCSGCSQNTSEAGSHKPQPHDSMKISGNETQQQQFNSSMTSHTEISQQQPESYESMKTPGAPDQHHPQQQPTGPSKTLRAGSSQPQQQQQQLFDTRPPGQYQQQSIGPAKTSRAGSSQPQPQQQQLFDTRPPGQYRQQQPIGLSRTSGTGSLLTEQQQQIFDPATPGQYQQQQPIKLSSQYQQQQQHPFGPSRSSGAGGLQQWQKPMIASGPASQQNQLSGLTDVSTATGQQTFVPIKALETLGQQHSIATSTAEGQQQICDAVRPLGIGKQQQQQLIGPIIASSATGQQTFGPLDASVSARQLQPFDPIVLSEAAGQQQLLQPINTSGTVEQQPQSSDAMRSYRDAEPGTSRGENSNLPLLSIYLPNFDFINFRDLLRNYDLLRPFDVMRNFFYHNDLIALGVGLEQQQQQQLQQKQEQQQRPFDPWRPCLGEIGFGTCQEINSKVPLLLKNDFSKYDFLKYITKLQEHFFQNKECGIDSCTGTDPEESEPQNIQTTQGYERQVCHDKECGIDSCTGADSARPQPQTGQITRIYLSQENTEILGQVCHDKECGIDSCTGSGPPGYSGQQQCSNPWRPCLGEYGPFTCEKENSKVPLFSKTLKSLNPFDLMRTLGGAAEQRRFRPVSMPGGGVKLQTFDPVKPCLAEVQVAEESPGQIYHDKECGIESCTGSGISGSPGHQQRFDLCRPCLEETGTNTSQEENSKCPLLCIPLHLVTWSEIDEATQVPPKSYTVQEISGKPGSKLSTEKEATNVKPLLYLKTGQRNSDQTGVYSPASQRAGDEIGSNPQSPQRSQGHTGSNSFASEQIIAERSYSQTPQGSQGYPDSYSPTSQQTDKEAQYPQSPQKSQGQPGSYSPSSLVKQLLPQDSLSQSGYFLPTGPGTGHVGAYSQATQESQGHPGYYSTAGQATNGQKTPYSHAAKSNQGPLNTDYQSFVSVQNPRQCLSPQSAQGRLVHRLDETQNGHLPPGTYEQSLPNVQSSSTPYNNGPVPYDQVTPGDPECVMFEPPSTSPNQSLNPHQPWNGPAALSPESVPNSTAHCRASNSSQPPVNGSSRPTPRRMSAPSGISAPVPSHQQSMYGPNQQSMYGVGPGVQFQSFGGPMSPEQKRGYVNSSESGAGTSYHPASQMTSLERSGYQDDSVPNSPTLKQLNENYDNYLKQWVQEIPIKTKTTAERQSAEKARASVYNGVWKCITKMKLDHDIFNNSYYYHEVFNDEIEELLKNLPKSKELDDNRPRLTAELLQNTIYMNELIKSTNAPASFNQQLIESIENTLPKRTSAVTEETKQKEQEEIQKNNLADYYILYKRYKDEESIKPNVHKRNFLRNLDDFLDNYKGRHGVVMDTTMAANEIINSLEKVPTPNIQTIKDEADDILLGMEVENWISDLPLSKPDSIGLLEKKRIRDSIVKKIQDLGTAVSYSDNSFSKPLKEEISKYLDRLPIQRDANKEFMIEELANRIRNISKHVRSLSVSFQDTVNYEEFSRNMPSSYSFAEPGGPTSAQATSYPTVGGPKSWISQQESLPQDGQWYSMQTTAVPPGMLNWSSQEPRSQQSHNPNISGQISMPGRICGDIGNSNVIPMPTIPHSYGAQGQVCPNVQNISATMNAVSSKEPCYSNPTCARSFSQGPPGPYSYTDPNSQVAQNPFTRSFPNVQGHQGQSFGPSPYGQVQSIQGSQGAKPQVFQNNQGNSAPCNQNRTCGPPEIPCGKDGGAPFNQMMSQGPYGRGFPVQGGQMPMSQMHTQGLNASYPGPISQGPYGQGFSSIPGQVQSPGPFNQGQSFGPCQAPYGQVSPNFQGSLIPANQIPSQERNAGQMSAASPRFYGQVSPNVSGGQAFVGQIQPLGPVNYYSQTHLSGQLLYPNGSAEVQSNIHSPTQNQTAQSSGPISAASQVPDSMVDPSQQPYLQEMTGGAMGILGISQKPGPSRYLGSPQSGAQHSDPGAVKSIDQKKRQRQSPGQPCRATCSPGDPMICSTPQYDMNCAGLQRPTNKDTHNTHRHVSDGIKKRVESDTDTSTDNESCKCLRRCKVRTPSEDCEVEHRPCYPVMRYPD